MSGKFDWHTADESSWEELDTLGATTAVPRWAKWTSRFFSRSFIIILSILLLLIILGSRQILLRAQETNERIEADILTAHNFMQQSALDRDPERLDLLLSEHDFQWRNLQRVLMRRSLLFDRGPFNLWLDQNALRQQPAGNNSPSGLVLSPDLTTAELTSPLPYITQTPDGTIAPLLLNHLSYFAYDGIQWRQIPPPAELWGPTETYNGQMITLDYPARDAEISRYLAPALDDLFLALCRLEPAVECPSTPNIHVTFSVDSEAFLPLSRPVQGNRFWIFGDRMAAGDTFHISLPTPALVGLPQSLGDRQVLLNGYAGWLLTSYLARKHPHLSFAQIDRRMDQLNLQLPPPVGYKPLQTGAVASLPAGQALLTCSDGDHITEQWTYDFTQNKWSPLDPGICLNCDRPTESYPASPDGRFSFSGPANSEQTLLAQFEAQAETQLNLEQLISQQALLSAIPQNRNIPSLRLDALLSHETDPGHLLVLAGNGFHEQFLFKVNLESGDINLVTNWVDNGSNFRSLDMTENGRFLTVLRHSTRRTNLTLIDLYTGRRKIMDLAGRPISRYAWSADEQWLLVTDDRLLHLISPAGEINLTFKHTHEDCTAISWTH